MKWYTQPISALETVPAFQYLRPWQQQMVRLSFELWQREYQNGTDFPDYSFVVFPMGKAYEGFLKHFLLDVQLIDDETFRSKKFRIGRALNPDVRYPQRNGDWLYDDIARECSPQVARQMWDAWLEGRNRVFHYFPDHEDRLNLAQAGNRLQQMFEAMQVAVACSTPAVSKALQELTPTISLS